MQFILVEDDFVKPFGHCGPLKRKDDGIALSTDELEVFFPRVNVAGTTEKGFSIVIAEGAKEQIARWVKHVTEEFNTVG